MYGRGQHNIVNQLSSNEKKKEEEKKNTQKNYKNIKIFQKEILKIVRTKRKEG